MEYPQYDPQSEHLPLSDEELSTLDDMLGRLPNEDAMNIEALDGYLAGLLLSPQPLQTLAGATWLPPVWGGDGAGEGEHHPFVSGKQKKRVQLLVLRHLRAIAWQWQAKPELWEPIFSIAEQDEGEEDLVDAEVWALGFMAAVELAPAAWAALFADAQTGPLLAPIAQLGSEGDKLSDGERDELSRAVLDKVLQLWALRSST
ncbi:uncharacterized protein HNP55_004511 [Paucibacter oligotrophus]|uniref:YecA family protein n=1 Tax=Roseateles oligotrophus TaxID=1769250 RepID=A0A840LKY2_9BURK|nr:UPF0149 family protein [Roseateles oligotrophus]MBB4845957.1 uncharacterized protein [Roseateles oligotrophus]